MSGAPGYGLHHRGIAGDRHGITRVLWREWIRVRPIESVVNVAAAQLRSHADGGLSGGNPDRTATIQALPAIVAGLAERGYEMKTVSEIIDPAVCNSTGS